MAQKVEVKFAREMPTADGSEDPDDFIHTGVINGKPPILYPALSYLEPAGMSVEDNIVTARIKIDTRPVYIIGASIRIQDSFAEYWSVTPEELYYITVIGSWTKRFNLTGDLGVWACEISKGDYYAVGILASGPQDVGGFTVPAGSVAVDLQGGAVLAFLVSSRFTVSSDIDELIIDFDYFIFEDTFGERDNTSRIEIYWWGDSTDGSEIVDIGTSEAGENSFFINTIPSGAEVTLNLYLNNWSSSTRLVASIASIKLTST